MRSGRILKQENRLDVMKIKKKIDIKSNIFVVFNKNNFEI